MDTLDTITMAKPRLWCGRHIEYVETSLFPDGSVPNLTLTVDRARRLRPGGCLCTFSSLGGIDACCQTATLLENVPLHGETKGLVIPQSDVGNPQCDPANHTFLTLTYTMPRGLLSQSHRRATTRRPRLSRWVVLPCYCSNPITESSTRSTRAIASRARIVE